MGVVKKVDSKTAKIYLTQTERTMIKQLKDVIVANDSILSAYEFIVSVLENELVDTASIIHVAKKIFDVDISDKFIELKNILTKFEKDGILSRSSFSQMMS